MSETSCRAPFIWRVVAPSGLLRPCCAFRGTIGNTTSFDDGKFRELTEALASGVKHSGCQECWHREALGFSSHRLHSPEWQAVPDGIRILDFNLSSVCNLKCRMCNGDSSTSWVDEEIQLSRDPEVGRYRKQTSERMDRAFASDKDLLRYLDKIDFSMVKTLAFKGGEPLLHPQLYLILDYVLARGYTDIAILFTSNGTIVPKNLDILNEFNNVEFTLSIEATGPLYEYIRGGKAFSIQAIENNLVTLRKYKHFKFTSNSCLGAYNLFDLADLYIWLRQHVHFERVDFVHDHWVSISDPNYLGFKALPLDLREQALDFNLKQLRARGYSDPIAETAIAKILNLAEPHSDLLLQQFIGFTKKLDLIRQESILAVVPQLECIFGERSYIAPDKITINL